MRLTAIAILPLLLPLAAAADPPKAGPAPACLMLNNRIIGPRSQDRPLPLSAGDASKGFRHACSVPWSVLSPKNQPLPIQACYRGSLLQIENRSACGADTGPLWISARWVLTTAELAEQKTHTAICQQLETGAWAGTRDFSIECATRPPAEAAAKTGTPPSPAPTAH